jgi:hypothetical protein
MGFLEDISVIKNRGDLFATTEYIDRIVRLRKIISEEAHATPDQSDDKLALVKKVKSQVKLSAESLGILSNQFYLKIFCEDVGLAHELLFSE